MRKLVVCEWMSLDGVVQAPSSSDEDRSDGFEHGGWHSRYFDDVSLGWVAENLARAEGFLLGRRTYEMFAAYWPNAGEAVQAFARPLNTKPKHVASTTLAAPLAWQGATLFRGDVVQAVTALKREAGGELHVIGSTGLAQTLFARDLVDELQLMIDPVLLGGGKRPFPEDGLRHALKLVRSQVTATGAILATYAREAG